MKRLFWIDGRLPWPLVVGIAYVSASLVGIDYVWRVLVMPFDALMMNMLVAEVALAAALIGAYRVWWRKGRRG